MTPAATIQDWCKCFPRTRWVGIGTSRSDTGLVWVSCTNKGLVSGSRCPLIIGLRLPRTKPGLLLKLSHRKKLALSCFTSAGLIWSFVNPHAGLALDFLSHRRLDLRLSQPKSAVVLSFLHRRRVTSPDKFLWARGRLPRDQAGELPNHIGLMLQTKKMHNADFR